MSNTSKTISLKEFRMGLPDVIDQIARGTSFTIVKRSKPVFQVNPIQDEGEWTTVVDFTEIDKKGVPVETVLEGLRKLRKT